MPANKVLEVLLPTIPQNSHFQALHVMKDQLLFQEYCAKKPTERFAEMFPCGKQKRNEQNKVQTDANKLYLVRHSLFLTTALRGEENVSPGRRAPRRRRGSRRAGRAALCGRFAAMKPGIPCQLLTLEGFPFHTCKLQIHSKKLHEMEL